MKHPGLSRRNVLKGNRRRAGGRSFFYPRMASSPPPEPYLRGGAQEPLTRGDVTDKFALNAQHGGWTTLQGDATLKLLATLYDGRIDLSALRS